MGQVVMTDRAAGLAAARRIDESLVLIAAARSHCKNGKRGYERSKARKSLASLRDALQEAQRQLLSSDPPTGWDAVLVELDRHDDKLRKFLHRRPKNKRLWKVARRARRLRSVVVQRA